MLSPLFERTAILGLGLIGGSAALAALERGLTRTVVAFDPDVQRLAEASAQGLIEQGYSGAADAVAEADAVLLAAPVRAILTLLPTIAPALRPGTLVLDLGSTKQQIVAAMAALPPSVRAVGGHPMAGKEESGFAAAEPTLFIGATFALCPTAHTDARARTLAEAVAVGLGARPLWLDAAAHDEAVAHISHLPYTLAATLARSAAPEGIRRTLAASGYRDSSRLAASDPTMMLDILLTNRAALLHALHSAQAELSELAALLEAADEAALRAWLVGAQARR